MRVNVNLKWAVLPHLVLNLKKVNLRETQVGEVEVEIYQHP